MANEKLPPYLKLVEPNNQKVTSRNANTYALQPDLFPMAKPDLLIFSNSAKLSAETFSSLIAQAQPSLLLDLRPFPKFDFGSLNRKVIFDIFKKSSVLYLDVTGLIGITSKWDAKFNPSLMARSINDILHAKAVCVSGPVIILFDDSNLLSCSIEVFPDMLMPRPWNKRWEVCLYP